jgi:hypothetical protein
MLTTTFLVPYTTRLQKSTCLGSPSLPGTSMTKTISPGNSVNSNGATIKSSGCCLRLTWDHGKHMSNFMYRYSTLPEILLYQGHRYFSVFCSRLRKCNNDGIACTFSSAFFIFPSQDKTAALVSDNKDSEKDTEDTMHRNHKEAAKEEWYTPPPSPPCPTPPPPLSSPFFPHCLICLSLA